MVVDSISYGSTTLLVASTTSHNVIVRRNITLRSVPIISARCKPKVYFIVAGPSVILRATIEKPKPIISEARWAVSVNMAIELAKIPPVSYAAMKNTDTNATIFNFLIDAL